MADIRLVVSDIDGTLLTSEGEISPATRREIRRVAERGVHFSIASARPTLAVRRALEGIELPVPVISSNGAVIEDLVTGEVIRSAYLGRCVAARVLEIVAEHEVYWALVATPDGWAYRTGRNPDRELLGRVLSALEPEVVDNWDGYLEGEPAVLKVLVHGREAELERLEGVIGGVEGVHVTSSSTGNREVTLAGADKVSAAQMLAERLGIGSECTMAIGDGRNDLDLVEWAGVGVAMGNAVPELKRAAEWVTASNDEDGVALALARFVP